MSGARLTARVAWAVAALASLLALPAASVALGVSADVNAPLIGSQPLDLGVATDGLGDVAVQAPLLPATHVGLPAVGLDLRTGPDGRQGPASAPSAPAATPPGVGAATRIAAGQATGAAAMGALVAAPALPWETVWALVSQWVSQAREAARPALRGAIRPLGRYLKAIPFLVPLFSRVGSDRLLENPVRARVHEAIALDPGLSLQDVRDRAGVAWGTTVHHLTRLERHGLVVSVRHGNHRRYFPANSVSSRYRRELAALSHPTAHRIATHVTACPGTDQKGVCRALDLQNPAASKHLTRFESLGLVQSEVVGRSRLYHPTELMASALAALSTLGGLAPQPSTTQQPIATGRMPLRDAIPLGEMASADMALAT